MFRNIDVVRLLYCSVCVDLSQVTILHEPSAVPVLAQPFQVVVGAVSAAEYSITVSGRLAEEGKVAVERMLKHAKEVQAVVPELTGDLEDLWNSLRLFERKLLVVKGMMAEARSEALRCERDMEMCYDELHADDRFPVNEQLLDETDRADVYAEIRTLEVEFAHWARIFTVRAKERDDTYEMRGRLGENRREILVRKTKIVQELAHLREHVPAAIGNVMGLAAATEAALTLNTSFQPSDNHRSKWSRVAGMNKGACQATHFSPSHPVQRFYCTHLDLVCMSYTTSDVVFLFLFTQFTRHTCVLFSVCFSCQCCRAPSRQQTKCESATEATAFISST